MITGIWVKAAEDDVIIEMADEDGEGDAVLTEVFCGRMRYLDSFDHEGWTRVFPPTGVHNQISGSTGRVIQAGNVIGGIHIGH